MIEIGVDRSGSLEFWREYFPDLEFWGVDIRAKQKIEEVHEGVQILRGDQTDLSFLKALIKLVDNSVDFIIDDGSHIPDHQITTFDLMFREALAPGGIYIVEDIETSYWKRHKLYGYDVNYGVGHPKSTVEIFRKIMDCCNMEYCNGILYTPNDSISHKTQKQIELITFAQNAIIIMKKNPDKYGQYYGRKYRSNNYV